MYFLPCNLYVKLVLTYVIQAQPQSLPKIHPKHSLFLSFLIKENKKYKDQFQKATFRCLPILSWLDLESLIKHIFLTLTICCLYYLDSNSRSTATVGFTRISFLASRIFSRCLSYFWLNELLLSLFTLNFLFGIRLIDEDG